MENLHRAVPDQVQLAQAGLGLQQVDATQGPGLEHLGGDGKALQQGGESVGHQDARSSLKDDT